MPLIDRYNSFRSQKSLRPAYVVLRAPCQILFFYYKILKLTEKLNEFLSEWINHQANLFSVYYFFSMLYYYSVLSIKQIKRLYMKYVLSVCTDNTL